MLPTVTAEFRAAADPDLRFAPSGVAVCKVRAVASSRKKQDDGTWVDDKTAWVYVIGFKKIAENMAESIIKGDLINVTGKLQTEDWEDKDGNKRTSVNIVVDTIGPSLTFNAARVLRSDRDSGGSSNSGGGGGGFDRSSAPASNDPWGSPAGDEPPF